MKKYPEPLAPEEARKYIEQYKYQPDRVIAGSARAVAARMCVMLHEVDLDFFQRILYDESYDLAYQLIARFYTVMGEPVPMFVRAYVGDPRFVAPFMESLSMEILAEEEYLETYMDWINGYGRTKPFPYDPDEWDDDI